MRRTAAAKKSTLLEVVRGHRERVPARHDVMMMAAMTVAAMIMMPVAAVGRWALVVVLLMMLMFSVHASSRVCVTSLQLLLPFMPDPDRNMLLLLLRGGVFMLLLVCFLEAEEGRLVVLALTRETIQKQAKTIKVRH
jgi:hypothetical protein